MTVSYFVICFLIMYFSKNFYLIYGVLWSKVLIVVYAVSTGCLYWWLNPEDCSMTLHCCEIVTFPIFLNEKKSVICLVMPTWQMFKCLAASKLGRSAWTVCGYWNWL